MSIAQSVLRTRENVSSHSYLLRQAVLEGVVKRSEFCQLVFTATALSFPDGGDEGSSPSKFAHIAHVLASCAE